MKSVGIVTVHGIPNHGSVLQSLALCNAVRRLGYDVSLIDYAYPTFYHQLRSRGYDIDNVAPGKSGFRVFVKRLLLQLGLKPVIVIWRMMKSYFPQRRKRRKFADFRREYLPLTPRMGWRSLHGSPPVFDIYMTGSDQTWNARYLHRDYTFLLDFVPVDKPRISYAASFGTKGVDEVYWSDYSRLLRRYRSISVREASGVETVRDLAGMEAVQVADPTLLIGYGEWMKFAAPMAGLPNRFIFCYCIDYVFNPFPEIKTFLSRLSDRLNGCDVVFYSCNGGHNREAAGLGWQIVPDMGPGEFLRLMDAAELVVSTSFHGVAFSVNFQKNFFAVINPWPSADCRVADFLDSVGLSDRGVNLVRDGFGDGMSLQVDYGAATPRLDEMRKRSMAYLLSSLSEAGGAGR